MPENSPIATLQGIVVPAEAVNPGAFYALTRRKRDPEHNASFAGLGGHDSVELRKADILAGIRIRFSGKAVIAGTTVKPTFRFPYDLIKSVKFTANGQSNLISCSGAKLKVREQMREIATDRGVSKAVSAGTATQGTLSKASESWGLTPNAAAAAGTYDIELDWLVPVAEDLRDLSGAIFAQTSSQDLVLSIEWNDESTLFTGVGGANTVAITGKLIVESEKYSIPSVNGHLVVPDLSLFHSYIETRQANSLAAGTNELRLSGQGAGRQLLRLIYQVWSGSTPAPLEVNATNYSQQAWRYGSNETPETYSDGMSLRLENENTYGSDIAGVFGFMAHEFNLVNAFRDTVDMGQTSELRLVVGIGSGASLTNPAIEYVQETMFQA